MVPLIPGRQQRLRQQSPRIFPISETCSSPGRCSCGGGGKAQVVQGYSVAGKVIRESALPESEKSVYRMAAETNVLISAGTETTARTLAIAHVCQL